MIGWQEDPFPIDEDDCGVVEEVARSLPGPASDGGKAFLSSPAQEIERFNTTESGNAEYVAARYGGDLRYDHAARRWLVFNGNRWRPDTDGFVVRIVLQAALERYMAAAGVKGEERKRKIANWAITSESGKNIQNTMFIARHLSPIADEGKDWDEKPLILGVENGVIDLTTGTLRPGRREDRITMSTGCAYSPEETAPRFEQFLEEIFEGNREVIDFVQRAAGYTLTGTLREEIFLLLFGSGQNGKTKFVTALQEALGDYATEISFLTLEKQKRRSGEATPDLATLPGKRFVAASEGRGEARWDERRVKALTGRDRVVARAMYKSQITFLPRCVFWLSTNHKPQVEDTTESFWRRIYLIPFDRYFTPEERDPDLQEKLSLEKEGILAWLVRGALAYQERGLDPPEIVLAATSKYRDDEDRVKGFMADCCVIERDGVTTKSDLYDAYVSWAVKASEEYLKKKSFGIRIGNVKGIREGRLGSSRTWEGIRLTDEAKSGETLDFNNGRSERIAREEAF